MGIYDRDYMRQPPSQGSGDKKHDHDKWANDGARDLQTTVVDWLERHGSTIRKFIIGFAIFAALVFIYARFVR